MKTDVHTEKLFCVALLRCGTDIAAKVLTEYIKVRDSKAVNDWLITIDQEKECDCDVTGFTIHHKQGCRHYE